MTKMLLGVLFLFLAGLTAGHAQDGPTILANIPEKLESKERDHKYQDPLNEQLKAQSLGSVTKGGTARDSKTNEIVYVWVDIQVNDIKSALPAVRQILQSAGAPDGTTLKLNYSATQVEEVPLYIKPEPPSYFGLWATLFYIVVLAGIVAVVLYFKKNLHL